MPTTPTGRPCRSAVPGGAGERVVAFGNGDGVAGQAGSTAAATAVPTEARIPAAVGAAGPTCAVGTAPGRRRRWRWRGRRRPRRRQPAAANGGGGGGEAGADGNDSGDGVPGGAGGAQTAGGTGGQLGGASGEDGRGRPGRRRRRLHRGASKRRRRRWGRRPLRRWRRRGRLKATRSATAGVGAAAPASARPGWRSRPEPTRQRSDHRHLRRQRPQGCRRGTRCRTGLASRSPLHRCRGEGLSSCGSAPGEPLCRISGSLSALALTSAGSVGVGAGGDGARGRRHRHRDLLPTGGPRTSWCPQCLPGHGRRLRRRGRGRFAEHARAGGLGGRALATIAVTPGETLR